VLATGIVCLLALAAAPAPTARPASGAAERLESLKKLAGDWVQVDKDGKASGPVVSSIRVTAGGTAVQETSMPGSDHEMITVYHLDGRDLVLTHYCSLGNQPHMKADAAGDSNRIAFKYVGATNLASPNDDHLGAVTITLLGPDHYQSEWIGCKDGAECHKVNLDLMRKAKN